MAARTDQASEPAILADLLEVRRATAYLTRKVNEVADSELQEPSLLEGWTRAHVIAHVSYNARALSRLAMWANTGQEHPMYSSPEARNDEIQRGATLLPHALRHLFDHSAVSLNVLWRDTPDEAWTVFVKTANGREVPFSETVWMRLREVWLHAIDLDNGGRWTDIPEDMTRRLIRDITGMWSTRDLPEGYVLLDPQGQIVGDSRGEESPETTTEITGPLPDLLAWASGRSREPQRGRLQVAGGSASLPESPRWI